MTTSMNNGQNNDKMAEAQTINSNNGAFADALTLVRVLLTPVIMFVIYKAWSANSQAEGAVLLDLRLILLASILFIIAAITDLLDDYFGGSATAKQRHFGWFDDIADSVLINGSLLALVWVFGKANILHWSFAIPVVLLIARDLIVGLKKGYEISKFGFLESRLGDYKSALAMLATCTLIASPWITNIIDRIRANNSENMLEVFGQSSNLVWNFGLVILWLAAALSLWTGYKIMTTDFAKLAKEQEKQEEKLKKQAEKLAEKLAKEENEQDT